MGDPIPFYIYLSDQSFFVAMVIHICCLLANHRQLFATACVHVCKHCNIVLVTSYIKFCSLMVEAYKILKIKNNCLWIFKDSFWILLKFCEKCSQFITNLFFTHFSRPIRISIFLYLCCGFELSSLNSQFWFLWIYYLPWYLHKPFAK